MNEPKNWYQVAVVPEPPASQIYVCSNCGYRYELPTDVEPNRDSFGNVLCHECPAVSRGQNDLRECRKCGELHQWGDDMTAHLKQHTHDEQRPKPPKPSTPVERTTAENLKAGDWLICHSERSVEAIGPLYLEDVRLKKKKKTRLTSHGKRWVVPNDCKFLRYRREC